LNVIPVYVPALRDRGDDLIRLTEHFAAEFASEYGRRPKKFAPEAVAVLRAYRWPGNVRELRNTLESILILGQKEAIEESVTIRHMHTRVQETVKIVQLVDYLRKLV